MLSKNQQKLILSLGLKKNRMKENLFVAEGKKLIEELLHSPYRIQSLFLLEEHRAFAELHDLAQKTIFISERELKQISSLKTPSFGLATVSFLPRSTGINKSEKAVVLYQIQDPGNVGTILRTAEWFGFTQLILTEGCADVFSQKVVQASMGSLFRLSITTLNVEALIEKYADKLLLADLDGESLYEKSFSGNEWFVFGNEGHGFSDLQQASFSRVTIPKFGKTESLNVAQSAAIVLNQFCYATIK